MAFNIKNFVALGGQSTPSKSGTSVATPGGPQLWGYRTDDAAAAVDTANYFAQVGSMLEVGDIIKRVTINGAGVVQSVGDHVVMTKAAAGNANGTWNVDVSDTTALTITNTD